MMPDESYYNSLWDDEDDIQVCAISDGYYDDGDDDNLDG
jgi:hypothetical protein